MANAYEQNKGTIELLVDVVTVLAAVDIVWVFFFKQQPPVQFFHDIIAFVGTAGAGWLTWKAARKNKAL